ncbi:hypothetical protein BDW74DRAFT_130723 [Aspergillus multicolor]|uniref:uncharacterized protein n=1 Tax=Aspergillus multicolor TaxID=41759 RepID=UPI003CCD4495
MSTGPPVWSAQDEHEPQPPAETQTRARRSRRKKDDAAEPDRKETPKSVRSKDKDKDKEKEKAKEKEQDKEKEPKRPTRRPRDKSSSTSNNPTSAQSHPRKKPKLEGTPPKQSPDAAPAVSAAASIAPASTPVPAPATTTPVITPQPSSPIAAAPLLTNHSQPPPQSQMPQSRHLDLTSQLIHPTQPTSPQAMAPTTSPPYPTMISAPPSRPQSQPLAPPPQRSSGQNYDPIRSAFGSSSLTTVPPPAPASTSFSPPARPVSPRPFRASASPAISSIIDPPQSTSPLQYASHPYGSPSRAVSSYPPTLVGPSVAQAHLPPSSSPYGHQSPYGPPPQTLASQESQPHTRIFSSQPSVPPAVPEPSVPAPKPQQPLLGPTPMEVDTERPAPTAVEKTSTKESKTPTVPSSKPPSPKPSRPAKEVPPPLPQGSGLISNALFGVDDNSSGEPDQRTPNIVVHVPLKGIPNQIVNFARLAEEQYGFKALHPRLAAHKERLARVAAAGAALERIDRLGRGISAGESADEDLSFDAERDSEMDGDGATSAATAKPNEPADGTKKRRRRKLEEYDREDPFVDDSEMVWQEQAAASKDGFFVYSGPLVPEGDKIQVERADGTIKRGRGRGRGGRSRAPATTHQQLPLAAAIPISQETGLPIRGPGSRGGNINRRPRQSRKTDQDKAGGTSSQGRGGGASGRGGSNSTRGGKAPMLELAPRPNIAPAPPGLSSTAGPEIVMK